ncbi:hypothetical protein H0E87_010406 [Populus deltoides]|uniref:Uncharacterized protein n=1 Tax=Populus deltoides TaxID=3696 RepID=A0A8T2YSV6_POPDE|nr:hypothetical protein H0E87_010406 [Populus deltoides]
MKCDLGWGDAFNLKAEDYGQTWHAEAKTRIFQYQCQCRLEAPSVNSKPIPLLNPSVESKGKLDKSLSEKADALRSSEKSRGKNSGIFCSLPEIHIYTSQCKNSSGHRSYVRLSMRSYGGLAWTHKISEHQSIMKAQEIAILRNRPGMKQLSTQTSFSRTCFRQATF